MVVATLYNPWREYMRSVYVSIAIQYREKASIYHCRSGIGEIESILANNSDQPVSVEHPNLAQVVNVSLQHPWSCANASAGFSPVHLKEIVGRARQTPLKLCLECERKGIDLHYFGGDDDASHRERKDWMETLKQETTKIGLREVWHALRDFAMSVQG